MGRRSRSSAEGTANPPKRTRNRLNARTTSSREHRDKALGGEQDGRRVLLSDEEFREKNAALAVITEGKALTVETVDLQKDKNRGSHHTDEYEQEDLVLRRGQEFTFTLKFDRNINKAADVLIAKFAYGARPLESKGTLVRLPVALDGSEGASDNWKVKVTDLTNDQLTLTVSSEADAMIGKYELLFETKLVDSSTDFSKQDLDTYFYLIFNPWCKDDVVYMEDAAQRFEYVLNDTGNIWVGSAFRHHGRPWNFGQFERPVLEVALSLLDKAELADSGRNSAVSVIRCLSALTNSMDEDGLLEGRWTSEYPKSSTKPWEWTGSVAIIEQYHNTGRPVQYGQCWVFSGVITTLLRSVGIPTRSVTNFESAHDTDCSMTIDKHFDEDGEPVEHLNDSVWNFHVWNESFFRRLDLPAGYDGWQAHDATPQELSEGVMRCGPAPLAAIREGHVYLNFDTGFIFSEVNGDRIQWEVAEDGSMRVTDIDRHSVGRNISTKAVGSSMRHDLTYDYKYREGSEEERRVVKFVNQFSTRRKQNIYKKEFPKQVEFECVTPETEVGNDLEVGAKVKNVHSTEIKVKVRLTLASTFYTGVVGKKVKGELTEVTLAPNEEKTVQMQVSADEYEACMNAEAMFKLTATCRILDTNQLLARTQPFNLNKPGLRFEAPEKICSSVETLVPLKFTNKSNMKLHNCVFHVEGSYVVKAKTFPIRKVVHPGDEISVDVSFYPRRLGDRRVMATFSSDELTDIDGEVTVNVISKTLWEEPSDSTADGGEEPMENEGAESGGAANGNEGERSGGTANGNGGAGDEVDGGAGGDNSAADDKPEDMEGTTESSTG